MKLIHTILRLLVFVSALIISTAVLMTFLTKIPSNSAMIPWTKFISCFLEGAAAFVLSMALAYLRRGKPKSKDRKIAVILFGIYGCYVFVACLSAVFLFMTELNQKNIVATQADNTKSIAQDDYDRAKADYDRWDQLMTAEQQNIKPGQKFREYKGFRDSAEEKMKDAKVILNSKTDVLEAVNNIQASFSAIFPTAWRTLLITVFVVIMGFVYVLQVLTAWPLPLPEKENQGENVTLSVTSVTDDEKLCDCGCGSPRMPGSKYFSNACKTRASRQRKTEVLVNG